MDTLYLWQHTSPLTGRRVRTRHRLSEANAARTLIDPERIDAGALVIDEPAAVVPAGHWRCGFVRREDGAMVPSA